MGVTYGTLPANGDQLDSSVLRAHLDNVEAYICGGIITTDITDTTVLPFNLFRPETYAEGFVGVAGAMWSSGTYGNVGDPRFNRERQDILSVACLDAGRAPVFKCSKTIDVPYACKAMLFAQFGAYILGDGTGTGGFILTTPAGRICGKFRMCVRDRATNTTTVIAETSRQIEAMAWGFKSRTNKEMTALYQFSAAGTYDVWVEYVRSSPVAFDTDFVGVLVGEGTILIEQLNTA
jgi:hypothetical protein